MLKMQEQSLELMRQHQKRQRDALARVLTPEQLKVVEDEQQRGTADAAGAAAHDARPTGSRRCCDPAQGNSVGVRARRYSVVFSAPLRSCPRTE